MKKSSDSLFEISLIGLLMLVVLTILVLGFISPTKAADESYVCRDPRWETVRLEFHNLPTLPAGISWMSLADGGTFYGDVYVADALVDYPYNDAGITAGMVVLGTSDYTFELRGDANSPACDVRLSPIQDDGDIPSPPAPVPTSAAPQTAACPAVAVEQATNKPYCYTPGINGVVAIPPSPHS